MPTVKFDIQAFQKFRYNGIATYFIELSRHVNLLNIENFRIVQDGLLTANPNLTSESIFPIHYNSRLIKKFAMPINSRVSRILDYDLIHSTYYHKEFLNKISREKHFITIHDMIPEDFPQYFLDGNPHESKSEYVKNSVGIICVSEYTRKRLLSHYPWVSPRSIFVVNHGSKYGSDFSRFEDILAAGIRRDSDRNILFVGPRSGYKNFRVLLLALKLLIDDGIKVGITCAGGGAFTKSEQIDLDELGISEVVCQRDVSDAELRKLYLNSVCQVTTSEVEGFGLPLLEAMSLGCATIISSAEALHEVSSGNSLTFESKDSRDLADQILSILSNSKERNEIGRAGFSRASKLTWQATAMNTISAYLQVLERST